MSELLAWDGVWSRRMIDLMVPVAIGIEAEEARRQFGVTSAAIAGAFAKDGSKSFLEGLDRVQADARAAGKKPKNSVAKDLIRAFDQMGASKGKR